MSRRDQPPPSFGRGLLPVPGQRFHHSLIISGSRSTCRPGFATGMWLSIHKARRSICPNLRNRQERRSRKRRQRPPARRPVRRKLPQSPKRWLSAAVGSFQRRQDRVGHSAGRSRSGRPVLAILKVLRDRGSLRADLGARGGNRPRRRRRKAVKACRIVGPDWLGRFKGNCGPGGFSADKIQRSRMAAKSAPPAGRREAQDGRRVAGDLATLSLPSAIMPVTGRPVRRRLAVAGHRTRASLCEDRAGDRARRSDRRCARDPWCSPARGPSRSRRRSGGANSASYPCARAALPCIRFSDGCAA